MTEMLVGLLSALWLGILTSISPCPLATNIAAISFLSKKVAHPKMVLLSGLSYTFGRMIAYAILGFIIIHSMLSVPVIANFLQKYMNKALGPVLLFVGFYLLGIIKFDLPVFGISDSTQQNLASSGLTGSFALGFLFALSFCPISAALFFGSLIPLALNYKLGAALPFVYGIGTGLPVMLFAVAIAVGVASVSRWFHKLTKLEFYMRKITGAIFIVVGLYYTGVYLLRFF